MTIESDIAFLRGELERLQRLYKEYDKIIEQLCEDDLHPAKGLPKTSPDEERSARIAQDNGFDGNILRNLIPDENATMLSEMRQLRRRIELIPNVIAAVEEGRNYTKLATPKELRVLLGVSHDTVMKRLADQKPRNIKVHEKLYRVHKVDWEYLSDRGSQD